MPFVWKRLGKQTQSVQLWPGCREGPETIQRQRERKKERERAGGKEQRSEKVESTMDVKNYVSIRGVPYCVDSDQKSMIMTLLG